MILIDQPYLSDYLVNTIIRNRFDVVDTPSARQLIKDRPVPFISTAQAVHRYRTDPRARFYTSSENAIAWLEDHLPDTPLTRTVKLFKDKAAFRRALAASYPDFFFQIRTLQQLPDLDPTALPCPFIIKPNIGFFSLGVHCVNSPELWPQTLAAIQSECRAIQSLYPRQVLNTTTFIIEEFISGREFAVDVNFNDFGQPAILNILHHPFSSDSDVSDRLYFTSKEIILDNLNTFDSFLTQLGQTLDLRNFPLHLEVRIDDRGILRPIEINPLRFGGWCTTGDFTGHCFGFNSYELCLNNSQPDWHTILRDRDDFIYSLIVLNNSTGIPGPDINGFNYDKLLADLESPLHLARVNFGQFPLFGFLFTRTRRACFHEIERLFHSDLTEYLT